MKLLVVDDIWTILSDIGCFLSGVFTISLLFVGLRQIKKLNSSNELDVYYKLKKDFTSEESLRLLNCIIENEVNVTQFCQMTDNLGNVLSDELLNHIEDMCIFYERKLISLKTIIEGYGTIILLTHNNPFIQNYIQQKRNNFNNQNLHTGLVLLYQKINE